jgi:hypothetical protein
MNCCANQNILSWSRGPERAEKEATKERQRGSREARTNVQNTVRFDLSAQVYDGVRKYNLVLLDMVRKIVII